MSFSSEVKEELAKRISPARHCQIAELAAVMHFSGQYGRSAEGDFMIGFQTENEAVVRKGFTLLKKTYNIDTDVKISEEQMRSVIDKIGDLSEPVSPLLIKNSCCQRAFLRGAFLCIGSMSDPQKSYHLEFVCTDEDKARQLQSVIQGFDIEAKIVLRKKYYVVYLTQCLRQTLQSVVVPDIFNILYLSGRRIYRFGNVGGLTVHSSIYGIAHFLYNSHILQLH